MTTVTVRVIDCHVFRRTAGEPLFLLLKRARDRIYPGIWQCVTGKIEPDEKPFQTALREVREETGLVPQSLWTVEQVNQYYEAELDRLNFIPVFAAEVDTSDVILSDEHTAYQWCSLREAEQLLLWAQQKAGARRLYEMLTGDPQRLRLTRISF
ncbi:MAG: NUDIX pyrophosphatase [FCB group bacterium]|nr:NUDIX pyrophosphatase [FCB group bacterium]